MTSRHGPAIEVLVRGVCASNGQALLCRTRDDRNTYLPGGHVDFGESARYALVREFEEETGCRVTVGRFLGVVEHGYEQRGQRICEINLIFEVFSDELTPERPTPTREAHLSFVWRRLDALEDAVLEPAPLCRRLSEWLASERGAAFDSTLEA